MPELSKEQREIADRLAANLKASLEAKAKAKEEAAEMDYMFGQIPDAQLVSGVAGAANPPTKDNPQPDPRGIVQGT